MSFLGNTVSQFQTSSQSQSADAILGNLTRDQWNYYLSQFGGMEEDMIGELGNDALVGKARDSAVKQTQVAQGSFNRDSERYSLGGAPGAVTERLARMRAMGDATSTAQSVNTARIDERERKLGLGSSLMQLGRGVAAQGISGMSDVAGMEASRNAQNEQSKAQASANKTNTIASLGMLALAFM